VATSGGGEGWELKRAHHYSDNTMDYRHTCVGCERKSLGLLACMLAAHCMHQILKCQHRCQALDLSSLYVPIWPQLYNLHGVGRTYTPSCNSSEACVHVDGSNLTPMSPVMWGIAYEEINHA